MKINQNILPLLFIIVAAIHDFHIRYRKKNLNEKSQNEWLE